MIIARHSAKCRGKNPHSATIIVPTEECMVEDNRMRISAKDALDFVGEIEATEQCSLDLGGVKRYVS